MQLKNIQSNEVLVLPDDLSWTDEYQWSPVTATSSYLLTGALLIETAVRQAGRPITLQALEDMAWISRATLDHLYAWASIPELTMQLVLSDGRSFAVMFRHSDSAIESSSVLGFRGLQADSLWRVQLRLLAV